MHVYTSTVGTTSDRSLFQRSNEARDQVSSGDPHYNQKPSSGGYGRQNLLQAILYFGTMINMPLSAHAEGNGSRVGVGNGPG
jgi:hypothetical protein